MLTYCLFIALSCIIRKCVTVTGIGLGGGIGDRRRRVFRRSPPSHVGALQIAIRSKLVLLCDVFWNSSGSVGTSMSGHNMDGVAAKRSRRMSA
ncbi:hypothetical protein DPMN_085163 [Dreissena polymorpha]|uniref:Secreted protein n=1 Tax=Dreissena polymorpha TaxID=45954 RepID=A0A9D4BLL9_DREPO|nr:hypothetical protein DPMN_085163 [Dreissena polymorpha]